MTSFLGGKPWSKYVGLVGRHKSLVEKCLEMRLVEYAGGGWQRASARPSCRCLDFGFKQRKTLKDSKW